MGTERAARFAFSARSHPGKVREHNEDFHGVFGRTFVVADGMGGHKAGEVASRLAVEAIGEHMAAVGPACSSDEAANALRAAFEQAWRKLVNYAEAQNSWGMGTTVAACWIGEDELVSAHLGDSRTYLLGGGGEHLATTDHSWVMECVATGLMTREEARVHPRSNVVTRSLTATTAAASLEPSIQVWGIRPGDRIVIVSDGATDPIAEEEFRRVCRGVSSAAAAAQAIEEAALAGGGNDNITIIVVDVLS